MVDKSVNCYVVKKQHIDIFLTDRAGLGAILDFSKSTLNC